MSQIAILFGSLLIPSAISNILSPMLLYLNIIAGSLFIANNNKSKTWIVGGVLLLIGCVFIYTAIDKAYVNTLNYIKFIILFVFHGIVTFIIIKQIWQAKLVNKNVIFGMMSGFISLGLVGFFIFLSLEIINPESFSGLSVLNATDNAIAERLMYFSYITLMTIGYGEILPQTVLAQKATILVGLAGQFYLVIITAIVVGKFISQTTIHKKMFDKLNGKNIVLIPCLLTFNKMMRK